MQKVLLRNLFVLLLGVGVLSSCKEDEGVDSIFFRTDGSLAATLVDDNNEPIAEAKVSLYNYESESRVAVKYTDESGKVDFGRLEAKEYSMNVELVHSGEWFDFNEEIHVISGVNTTHDMNLADQRGEVLIRFFNNNTGELLDLNLGDMEVSIIPRNEDLNLVTNDEEALALAVQSSPAGRNIEIDDLSAASYMVAFNNGENIMDVYYFTIDPYNRSYVNIYLNPTSIIIQSKSVWTVSEVTSDNNEAGLIPMSTISFENGNMMVTFNNGEQEAGSYSLYSDGGFYWNGLSTSNYNFYYSEDNYEINSDGSITFNFSSWETYDYNTSNYIYDENVSITIN